MYQTFCMFAFSDADSLMNKYIMSLKVKFLYCCVINGGDFDTLQYFVCIRVRNKLTEHYSTEKYQVFVS